MNKTGKYVLKKDLRSFFDSDAEFKRFCLRVVQTSMGRDMVTCNRPSKFKDFRIPGKKTRKIAAPSFSDAYVEKILQKEREKLCQQLLEKATTAPDTIPVPLFRWRRAAPMSSSMGSQPAVWGTITHPMAVLRTQATKT